MAIEFLQLIIPDLLHEAYQPEGNGTDRLQQELSPINPLHLHLLLLQ